MYLSRLVSRVKSLLSKGKSQDYCQAMQAEYVKDSKKPLAPTLKRDSSGRQRHMFCGGNLDSFLDQPEK